VSGCVQRMQPCLWRRVPLPARTPLAAAWMVKTCLEAAVPRDTTCMCSYYMTRAPQNGGAVPVQPSTLIVDISSRQQCKSVFASGRLKACTLNLPALWHRELPPTPGRACNCAAFYVLTTVCMHVWLCPAEAAGAAQHAQQAAGGAAGTQQAAAGTAAGRYTVCTGTGGRCLTHPLGRVVTVPSSQEHLGGSAACCAACYRY
jgi:hypothetical protein